MDAQCLSLGASMRCVASPCWCNLCMFGATAAARAAVGLGVCTTCSMWCPQMQFLGCRSGARLDLGDAGQELCPGVVLCVWYIWGGCVLEGFFMGSSEFRVQSVWVFCFRVGVRFFAASWLWMCACWALITGARLGVIPEWLLASPLHASRTCAYTWGVHVGCRRGLLLTLFHLLALAPGVNTITPGPGLSYTVLWHKACCIITHTVCITPHQARVCKALRQLCIGVRMSRYTGWIAVCRRVCCKLLVCVPERPSS